MASVSILVLARTNEVHASGAVNSPANNKVQRKVKKNTSTNNGSVAMISRNSVAFPRLPRAINFTRDLYPDRYRIKLHLSDVARLTFDGTTGVVLFQLRSNSVNSPGISYTWHQPYLYDQLVSVYGKAVVYRTTGKFHFSIDSTVAVPPPILCQVTNQSTSPTAYTSYLESLYDVERERGVVKHCTAFEPATITYETVPHEVLGREQAEYSDDLFAEQTSTTINSYNPNYQLPWLISAICSDTTSTQSVTVWTDMYYEVEFFEKKSVAHS